MQIQTLRLISIASLFICFTVLLNSIHGKELFRSPLFGAEATRTQTHDSQDILKIQSDLHNHIDKAGKVMTDNPQADTRSLRLLQQRRNTRPYFLGLFNNWRDQLGLHLG